MTERGAGRLLLAGLYRGEDQGCCRLSQQGKTGEEGREQERRKGKRGKAAANLLAAGG